MAPSLYTQTKKSNAVTQVGTLYIPIKLKPHKAHSAVDSHFTRFLFMHGIEYPPKNSQIFVENAHYPNATPLNISIRTHSIPACFVAH